MELQLAKKLAMLLREIMLREFCDQLLYQIGKLLKKSINFEIIPKKNIFNHSLCRNRKRCNKDLNK